jgi:predicted glycoside hydrolase/deacetylase ChbG (UPF0249 family)
MILDTWLEQLRKAKTEQDVVTFAHAQLDRITAAGSTPEALRGHVLIDGEDLRRMAASLTRAQIRATATQEETDVVQQMLVLFSLATDRLNQLEGHGLARRAPDRAVPLR